MAVDDDTKSRPGWSDRFLKHWCFHPCRSGVKASGANCSLRCAARQPTNTLAHYNLKQNFTVVHLQGSRMTSSSSNSRISSAKKSVCFCMQPTVLLTSRTEANPGGRFFRCGYYNDPSKDCKFFRWMDEPRVPMKLDGEERHSMVDGITKLRADVEELKADFEELIHCVSQLKEMQLDAVNKSKHVDHLKDLKIVDIEKELRMKSTELERKYYICLALIYFLFAIMFVSK